MLDIVLSITVLAAIALLGGAWLAWKRGQRKQAGLMLVLVAVALVNVAIWTLPDEGGTAPLDRVEQGAGR
jgi:drug/metabolite transporter superfamily protein YnfA